jgi:hypothetical protein
MHRVAMGVYTVTGDQHLFGGLLESSLQVCCVIQSHGAENLNLSTFTATVDVRRPNASLADIFFQRAALRNVML